MQAFIRYYKENDMNYWAENTLDPSELAQFRAAQTANNSLWQSYWDQGLYTIQDVQETVHSIILDADIDIVTGQEIIMSSGVLFDSLSLHPDYIYWLDRYDQETGGDPLIPLVQ
jgi:hypothetical protein